MLANTFDFHWAIPETGGYMWVEAKSTKSTETQLVLTEKQGTEFKTYAPLREASGLFYTLAEMDPTPERVLLFANHYGHLGLGLEEPSQDCRVSPIPTPEQQPVPLLIPGRETFEEWRRNVYWMREIVRLWGFAKDGDKKRLK